MRFSVRCIQWFSILLVYRVLVCESIADSTILWKPWDRLVQNRSTYCKVNCAIPEAEVHPNRKLLPADNWWERRGLQGCAFDFVRGCSDTVTSAWAQWEDVRSKNPENKAKHCQMSFAAYAERCWKSRFHWHKFEIVLRTYAIFGVTSRLDTNNGSSRFFEGVFHAYPWFTMVYLVHEIRCSRPTAQAPCCGMLRTGQRIQLHTPECELGSRLAYEVDRSGIRFQNSQNSHWLYALEILMLMHVIHSAVWIRYNKY